MGPTHGLEVGTALTVEATEAVIAVIGPTCEGGQEATVSCARKTNQWARLSRCLPTDPWWFASRGGRTVHLHQALDSLGRSRTRDDAGSQQPHFRQIFRRKAPWFEFP